MDAVIIRMSELAEGTDLEIELSEFPRHPDIATALQNGTIDFGTVTTPDLMFMLDRGGSAEVLAGEALGGDYLAMRAGTDLNDWADLESGDLRIRTFAGGIAWLKFMASLSDNGIDPESIGAEPIAGGPPDMALLLKTDQADLVTNVDPHVAQGVLEGYAEYAPLDINQSRIGGLNAMFSVRSDLFEDDPELVSRVLNLYVEAHKDLEANPDEWLRVYRSYSGLEEDVARESLSHIELDYSLPQAELIEAANFMHDQGLTEANVSDQLGGHLRYDLLAEATGEDASALGQSE